MPRPSRPIGGRSPGSIVAAWALLLTALLRADLVTAQINPNPGFEDRDPDRPHLPSGWAVAATAADIRLDSLEARSDVLSLRIRGSEREGLGAVGRSLPADRLHHTRVTVRGYIKTSGVFPGYAGLLLRFDGGGETIFTDDMAGRGATGTADWTRFETSALVPAGADEIVFGALLPGPGTAWFDDIAIETEVPVRSPAPPATSSTADDPEAYLERALDLMEERSLLRDSIDWASFRSEHLAAAQNANSTDDAHAAIRRALEDLGDGHSELLTSEAAASRGDPDGAGSGPTAPLRSVRIGSDVGYLGIPGFIGTSQAAVTSFANQIDGLIRELDGEGVCGWVVDLRANPGGNMWPMLAGLAPLLGEGRVGSFVDPDGTSVPWTIQDGAARDGNLLGARVEHPHPISIPGAPVAVLIGPGTASSGEAVAIAFRGRSNTRSFGEATHGLSTSNLSLPLSDGAVLELTTSVFADREGTAYGNKIVPDERIPSLHDRGPSSSDPVTDSAVDWVRARPGCR